MVTVPRRSASQTRRNVPGTCAKTPAAAVSRPRRSVGPAGIGPGGPGGVGGGQGLRLDNDFSFSTPRRTWVPDEPARAEERRHRIHPRVGLVHRAGHPVLQHGRMGSRLLLGEREGAHGRPPARSGWPDHRPHGRGRGHPGTWPGIPGERPVHGRTARPGPVPQRDLRQGGGRAGLRGRLLRRLPDQGEPDARGGRGDPRRRRPLPLRARGRVQGRAHGGARLQRRPGRAHHLQRVQGRRVHAPGPARAKAGAQGRGGHREALRAPGAAPRRRGGRRGAVDRAEVQALHARHGEMGVVLRRLRQVRTHHAGDDRGGPHPRGRREEAPLQALPLPRGQPAHRDPRRQGRGERGGTPLRQAPQDGARHRVLRRGGRPGRRLRRARAATSTPPR